MISDTLEVTNYLRHRFGKEKIYLMGHSGGTFIGIQAAARAPRLYYAYLGVAQMSNQLKSERLAYEYMLQQFKANGNRSMVRKLEAAPVTMADGAPEAYLALRDKAMHSLGIGTTHAMHSVITGVFLPSLASREYTVMDKINLWRAKSRYGISFLWDKMIATDLADEVPQLDLPVGHHPAGCHAIDANSDQSPRQDDVVGGLLAEPAGGGNLDHPELHLRHLVRPDFPGRPGRAVRTGDQVHDPRLGEGRSPAPFREEKCR